MKDVMIAYCMAWWLIGCQLAFRTRMQRFNPLKMINALSNYFIISVCSQQLQLIDIK